MIWFTDRDADEAANHLCDKHLRPAIQFARKAVTEARENRTQQTCPYLRWACASRQNLKWTIDHAYGASQELYLRFRKCGRVEDIEFLLDASAFVGKIILQNQNGQSDGRPTGSPNTNRKRQGFLPAFFCA